MREEEAGIVTQAGVTLATASVGTNLIRLAALAGWYSGWHRRVGLDAGRGYPPGQPAGAGFPLALFPLVLGLTLFNYTLRFFKWHFYLGQVGVRITSVQAQRPAVRGRLPAGGDARQGRRSAQSRLAEACERRAVPMGVAVVAAERISDGLAVLALSTLGVIAFPQYWPAFASVLALAGGIILVSQIRPLALAAGTGRAAAAGEPFRAHPARFYEGSFMLFRPKATLLAVSLGTISWLGEGMAST